MYDTTQNNLIQWLYAYQFVKSLKCQYKRNYAFYINNTDNLLTTCIYTLTRFSKILLTSSNCWTGLLTHYKRYSSSAIAYVTSHVHMHTML